MNRPSKKSATLAVAGLLGVVLMIVLGSAVMGSYRLGRASSHVERSYFEAKALRAKKPEAFPVVGHCENPRFVKLVIRGSFTELKSVFEEPAPAERAETAVHKHLEYLNGYFNSARREGVDWHLSGAPTFKVLSQTQTRYGTTFAYDPVPDYITYAERFRKPTRIRADEPAVSMTYEAEQPAITCSVLNSLPASLELKLPRDPVFAYWSVPPDQREDLRLMNLRGHVNPCADQQVVDLPQPSMFWYVWNPTAQGYNEHGKTFDCRTKVVADLMTTASVTVRAADPVTQPIEFNKLFANSSVQASIIFGFVSRDPGAVVFEKAKAYFLKADLFKMLEDENPPESLRDSDPSFHAFSKFVAFLPDIMNVEKADVYEREGHLEFNFSGKFRETGKPLRMRLYLGSTGNEDPVAKHWQFMYDAFATDQIVFYIGHSGMGVDADLERMRTQLKLSKAELTRQLSKQTYQLFGVVGCFSMVYYSDQFFSQRPNDSQHMSDMMVMGSGTYKYALPLTLLRAIDLQQANLNPSVAKAFSLTLGDRDIASLHRQAQGPVH